MQRGGCAAGVALAMAASAQTVTVVEYYNKDAGCVFHDRSHPEQSVLTALPTSSAPA